MTTDLLPCDLRLGDMATAEIDGVVLDGTIVHVGAVYVMLMGTGYGYVNRRGMRIEPDPDGVVLVSKHSEITSIAPAGHVDELVDWRDRPVILCELCH